MSRRRLSDEERVLWKGVTRSIMPLRQSLAREPDEPAKRAAPPPLAPLTRRHKKRIARGNHAIDGRLDLHGMTQAEAHDALFRFLRAKQARGAKVVLVITGKGARGGDSGGRGVLNRTVPMWLRLPEFRSLILGFESAAAS